MIQVPVYCCECDKKIPGAHVDCHEHAQFIMCDECHNDFLQQLKDNGVKV